MADPFLCIQGTKPLLVSLPHGSTYIPPNISERMTGLANATPDTDWHVNRLYDFASNMGASVISATNSRYVIDLNRDPDGVKLYSDADNTELCPTTTFDRELIYIAGTTPDRNEIEKRIEQFWQPYHKKLRNELARIKDQFGVAILFDGHTIRSVVPRFYDGQIPALNLGTSNGHSAALSLAETAYSTLLDKGYTAVWDDRFTGGYITRKYGDPKNNIHAIQLELTWKNYMNEATYSYSPELANRLKSLLQEMLEKLLDWTNIQFRI